MNFKTIIRAAKLPSFKREYSVDTQDGTQRVAIADGYIAVWESGEKGPALDVDGNECEQPDALTVTKSAALINNQSPPLSEMVKVNSGFLRRIISAMETKGQQPIYLSIKNERICFAYQSETGLCRGIVACMRNVPDEQ